MYFAETLRETRNAEIKKKRLSSISFSSLNLSVIFNILIPFPLNGSHYTVNTESTSLSNNETEKLHKQSSKKTTHDPPSITTIREE